MPRPPLTSARMLGEASRAQVIYRSDIVHPRHQANFRSAERSTELTPKPLFDLPVPRSLSACNAQAGGAGQTGDLPIPDPVLVV